MMLGGLRGLSRRVLARLVRVCRRVLRGGLRGLRLEAEALRDLRDQLLVVIIGAALPVLVLVISEVLVDGSRVVNLLLGAGEADARLGLWRLTMASVCGR